MIFLFKKLEIILNFFSEKIFLKLLSLDFISIYLILFTILSRK